MISVSLSVDATTERTCMVRFKGNLPSSFRLTNLLLPSEVDCPEMFKMYKVYKIMINS